MCVLSQIINYYVLLITSSPETGEVGGFTIFWRVCSPQKGLKSADQMRVEKGAMVLVLHEQNSLIQTNLASLCSMRRGINLLLFSA
jgi:hypothetical protein